MTDLADEVDENRLSFANSWLAQLNSNVACLADNTKLVESYRRITSLQALKSAVIEPHYAVDAAGFFAEAQNDALTSHVLASFGAWRPALQALRSCIENALSALYYNDHPIELRLWSSLSFRVGFSDLHSYFCKHPDVSDAGLELSGLDTLKAEYGTLSKAVHASAPSFRMTDPAAKLLLWSDDPARVNMWSTRERKVIEGVCLLTTVLNQARLAGAAQPNVRAALGFAISAARIVQLKRLHIHVEEQT